MTARVEPAGVPDPVVAADVLLGVVDGLAAHVLGGHLDADRALAAFDRALDDLFGTAGR